MNLNKNYKLLQTMLTNYHRRTHFRHRLQTITELIQKIAYKLLLEKSFEQSLQIITREITPNNAYKVLSENSFQTML